MVGVEKYKRLSPGDRDLLERQLQRAYAQGVSIASLAASRRTSSERVRLILLERGVVLEARGRNTRRPDPQRLERAHTIAREYAAGTSLAQLGSTHTIAAATVRKLVLAAGGQLRAQGAHTPRPDPPADEATGRRPATATRAPARRSARPVL